MKLTKIRYLKEINMSQVIYNNAGRGVCFFTRGQLDVDEKLTLGEALSPEELTPYQLNFVLCASTKFILIRGKKDASK